MMDELQLKLCDIQGRLFELSGEKQLPSAAFIRAFMTSDVARELDSRYNRAQWMGEEYLLEETCSGAKSFSEPATFTTGIPYTGSAMYTATGIFIPVRAAQRSCARRRSIR